MAKKPSIETPRLLEAALHLCAMEIAAGRMPVRMSDVIKLLRERDLKAPREKNAFQSQYEEWEAEQDAKLATWLKANKGKTEDDYAEHQALEAEIERLQRQRAAEAALDKGKK